MKGALVTMAYDESKLGRGETIVYYARRHLIYLFKASMKALLIFIVALVLSIVILNLAFLKPTNTGNFPVQSILALIALGASVVGLIMFIVSYVQWRAEQYILTNERVIHTWGIINKNEAAVPLDKINDIGTHQTLLGRFMNFGTLQLQTGNEHPETMEYLVQPFDFKRKILDAKNRFYGDASDYAPGGRYSGPTDDEGEVPQIVPPQPRYVQPGYPQQPMPPTGYPQQVPVGIPYNDPRGYAPSQPQPQPGLNSQQQILQSIQQLAQLRDAGVITEEEFQTKKNDLMSRL